MTKKINNINIDKKINNAKTFKDLLLPKNVAATLFIKSWCGYSQSAIKELEKNGINYVYYDIEKIPEKLTNDMYKWLETKKLIERRTVPQIFNGNEYIGGYQELMEKYFTPYSTER